MRVLVDTHSFLWFITADPNLSTPARTVLEDLDNEIFVSVASLWEIAIKSSLGKLELTKPFGELFPQQLALCEIEMLGIHLSHLITLTGLPLHHRDPFDRMIIAQAMTENLVVLTKDSAFPEYPIRVVW